MGRQGFPVMSVTYTENYKEILKSETITIIENLLENDYELEEILQFVDVHGEDNIEYYEKYAHILNVTDTDESDLDSYIDDHGFYALKYAEKYFDLVNIYTEGPVNAYISLNCIDDISYFKDSYQGEYRDVEDFVTEILESMGVEIPSWVSVDYRQTWESALRFDYVEEDGYYFRNY